MDESGESVASATVHGATVAEVRVALPPPREVDPSKVYALYDYSPGEEQELPGLALAQDAKCELLDDSDACWWRVRECGSGREGYVPCELLETYPERLARFNSFKNEQALLNQVRRGPGYHGLRNYTGSKSVSFSDVVSYSDEQVNVPKQTEEQVQLQLLHPYIEELYAPVFAAVEGMLRDLDSVTGRGV